MRQEQKVANKSPYVCDMNKKINTEKIIAQDSTALTPEDTPDTIAEKVHLLEMKHFPKILECIFLGKFA